MGPTNKHLATLNLFAYDSYSVYKQSPSKYIDLNHSMTRKLRMISIAETASKESKTLYYKDLMKMLDVKEIRELEDLIIEAIYADLMKGKLDQMNQRLVVEYTYGRDVHAEKVPEMIQTLVQWEKQLAKTQELMEKQSEDCNKALVINHNKGQKLEKEIAEKRDKILKDLTEESSSHQTKAGMAAREVKNFLSGMGGGFLTRGK